MKRKKPLIKLDLIMKHNLNLKKIVCLVILLLTAVLVVDAQNAVDESAYKIKQVNVPDEKRPAVEYRKEQLPFKNPGGQLPAFDGEIFQLNIIGQNIKAPEDAKKVIASFLESLKSPLRPDKDIRLTINTTTSKTNSEYIDEQIRKGKEATKEKLKKEMLDVSISSENMLNELGNELRQQSNMLVSIYRFDQYFEDVLIDNTAISISNRSQSESISLQGKFYNLVKPTNKKSLALKDATAKAIAQIRKENKVENVTGNNVGEIVLLPYADGFKFVWKTRLNADGPYRVWIDAETGRVLQLFPEFFFDNAKGLVFNPSPTQGTTELTFEVDPPSGGNYTLRKTGVITLTNNGADGTNGIVSVTDDGSGTANFNVAPINGTVVHRTSEAGYNGQFQQVNAFAHVYNMIRLYNFLGSQPFSPMSITVNDNDACGYGINNACSGGSYMEFGIGNGTTGSSTACSGVRFNSALDATIIAHELGHTLNGLQYGVGGGSMTGSINEGLADFWAHTYFNMDISAGYFANNCTTPTQGGTSPRQSDPADLFPDFFSTGGSTEMHSSGQIVAWALWSARQGMNDATGFGTLSINMNTIKAMTTSGISLLNGTAKSIHDSYQNLLGQLAPLYQSSRMIHKLLAGFARAGIFLAPKDAIIAIDHSYLNRTSASGPVFTVWTGDDYTFSGNSVVTTGTLPFNTEFQIEIANDEAFSVNHITTAWLGGVSSAAGGTATWTMPVADWNTLKAGNDIYFKVTTRDGSGGNVRNSLQPGNDFLAVNVPAGRAAINGTGTPDCSCSASASTSSSAMALVPLLPIIGLIFYRRNKKPQPKN